jgi:DNA-directed RNA polymerase specialized sigma24 family protein
MTTHPLPSRPIDTIAARQDRRQPKPEDLYVHRLWNTAESLARRNGRTSADEARDVASRIVIKVLPRLEEYRAKYESPEVLAGVMTGHGVVDYRRNQAAQRGEGARLVPVHTPGSTQAPSDAQILRPRRVVESLDIETFIEPAHGSTEAPFVLLLEATEITRALVTTLRDVHQVSHRDLLLLIKVDAYGQKITDAAKDLGLRRETAQRALGRVRTLAQAVGETMLTGTRNGAEPEGPAPSH